MDIAPVPGNPYLDGYERSLALPLIGLLRNTLAGGVLVLLSEAKSFVGKVCAITWRDRVGNELSTVSKIYDATFVPLYGGYLITDTEDIRLDRIDDVSVREPEAAPQPIAA